MTLSAMQVGLVNPYPLPSSSQQCLGQATSQQCDFERRCLLYELRFFFCKIRSLKIDLFQGLPVTTLEDRKLKEY